MLYNLTDIFSSEGKAENLTTAYEPARVIVNEAEFPILECSQLSLTMENKAKGEVLLRGEISLVCEIPCGRCLQPVRVPLKLELEEYLKESMIGTPEAADEMSYVTGYELDTDVLVGNEILINWPMNLLCRDDCKGICSVCGKNLNEEECGCDTFVPDPRMAVLKDIFNA